MLLAIYWYKEDGMPRFRSCSVDWPFPADMTFHTPFDFFRKYDAPRA